MPGEENNGATSFILRPDRRLGLPAGGGVLPGSIPAELLDRHICRFCQVRWLIILLLGGYGALSYVPGFFAYFGMRERITWPLVCAGLLLILNVAYLSMHDASTRGRDVVPRMVNLWLQIVLDLVVLTAVVHYTGTQDTPAHLAYMFHIVLACIFMSRRMSFLVTVIACVLYGLCILAESKGILSPSSIYQIGLGSGAPGGLRVAISTISTQTTWLVVWLLASHWAMMVRARDVALSDTQRVFKQEREQKNNQMFAATNELRGLFAAIDANAQILLGGHCGVLPDDALDVALRISSRSRRLVLGIKDMLQLIQLDSSIYAASEPPQDVDLAELVRTTVNQLEAEAVARRIAFDVDLGDGHLPVTGVPEQLQTMLTHVISNSVIYSHDGGAVTIAARRSGGGGVCLRVRDHGLGIESGKLSRIFDDYYRAAEAVQHWRESTGLGLAIVRRIAAGHGVTIKVASEPGKGTEFELCFPPVDQSRHAKE